MTKLRLFSILALALAFTAGMAAAAEPGGDAKALFDAQCGVCHAAGGTGTFMLKRRLDAAQPALLAERTDLDPDTVRTVVRKGINSMPWFTRVQLPDQDLDAIAAYLTAPKSARGGQ